MFGPRAHGRVNAHLRLCLRLPTGELETVTEEVSRVGFAAHCAAHPLAVDAMPFQLQLTDGRWVSGSASPLRTSAEGLVDFACHVAEEDKATWEGALEQGKGQSGLWKLLHRSEANDQAQNQRPAGVLRLHRVGENGEAYRLLFEKQPSEVPDASDFARASPLALELCRRACIRLLTRDVLLKVAPHAEVEHLRVVELQKGGYGFMTHHRGEKPVVMGLQGNELLVVEVNGHPVFPAFSEDDLARIAQDTVPRPFTGTRPTPVPKRLGPMLSEERFSPAYVHTEVDTHVGHRTTIEQLRKLVASGEKFQLRQYGQRQLKLFPELWLEVERPRDWPGPLRGFAIEDGPELCLFVLDGPDAPRVVRLEAGDLMSLIRGGRPA